MKLSEFELDVMNIFWEHGNASAPDIHSLIKADRDVSYSTVKTIIDRLEEKGALARAKQIGRTIYYTAAVEREALSTPMLKGFLRRLFGDKPQTLIAHLLEHEELDSADIEQLEKLLADKKRRNRE